jgi:NADPH:quinone reductase
MGLAAQMRYIEISGFGGPEVMRVMDGPLPVVRPGDVLIRVGAAGVNRPDVQQRRGLYPPPADANLVLGLEVAGEVAAVGLNVETFAIGDRVCALTNGGGYAEYCAVPAGQCLPWPKDYDAVRAAAIPETFFTVWANIFQMARLRAGETLLVHGGTSGIGLAAILLANEFGARVFATAGSREKCAAAEKFGAASAIDYRTEDFAERISALTGGRGVDVILDIVGAPYFTRNLRCLAKDGRLSEVSAMLGAKVEQFDIAELMQRRATIMGSTMRPRSAAEKAVIARDLREKVWPVLDAGRCAPVIDSVFLLEQVAEAHRRMESSAHIGKIVLRVAG